MIMVSERVHELKELLLRELYAGRISKEDWIRLDTYCSLMQGILEK